MKLIINADDYGMNENVSNAIVESFKKDYINQTTLMVNAPWAEKAVALARKESIFDKIGLHLNLTEGKPLTERIAHSAFFCNEGGEFDKRFARSGHMYKGYSKEIQSLLSEEIEAQIKRYCSFGLPLKHFDSHHHVHHRLPLARIVMPIAARYGMKSVRPPYSIGFKGLGAFLRDVRNRLFRCVAINSGIVSVDDFGATESFMHNPYEVKGDESLELMVHPFYNADGSLIDIVRYDYFEGPLLSDTIRQVKEVLCRIS